jgi:hypothetical protein
VIKFVSRYIAIGAADFTLEFNCTNPLKEIAAPVSLNVDTVCPPPSSISKLNVDAGCFNDGYVLCAVVVKFLASLVSNQVGQFIVESNSDIMSYNPYPSHRQAL